MRSEEDFHKEVTETIKEMYEILQKKHITVGLNALVNCVAGGYFLAGMPKEMLEKHIENSWNFYVEHKDEG